MGCDIHLYVEKKVDGAWVTADEWISGSYGLRHKAIYDSRNYYLFAILADVRNGVGFAGYHTGERLNPIADPRGFPDDACEEVKLADDKWDDGGHSHSYFTVEELLAYDWTQKTTKRGWVDAVAFYRWSCYGKGRGDAPQSFSVKVYGSRTVEIRSDEMEKRLKSLNLPDSSFDSGDVIREKMSGVLCLVSWEKPYSHVVSDFWVDTIPRLLRIGKPENVRIIFWFDN